MTARCTHDRCDIEEPHIHVSELEAFRYWKENDGSTHAPDQGGTLELAKRLREGFTGGSANVAAGKAFAEFMEHAQDGEVGAAHFGGWTFTFEANAVVELGDFCEVEGTLTVNTPIGPVLVVGHADSLTGRTVRDQKLTEKIDAEKYMDSLQWRVYLVMFGATTFIYDLFLGRYRRVQGEIVPGEVKVTEYHRLPFYTYPGIKGDVQAAVTELAMFMARHVPERMGLSPVQRR